MNHLEQLRLLIADKLQIPPRQQNFLNWKNKSYDDRVRPLRNGQAAP